MRNYSGKRPFMPCGEKPLDSSTSQSTYVGPTLRTHTVRATVCMRPQPICTTRLPLSRPVTSCRYGGNIVNTDEHENSCAFRFRVRRCSRRARKCQIPTPTAAAAAAREQAEPERKASSAVQYGLHKLWLVACHVSRAALADLNRYLLLLRHKYERHTWGAEATIGGPSLACPASPRAPVRLLPNMKSSPDPFGGTSRHCHRHRAIGCVPYRAESSKSRMKVGVAKRISERKTVKVSGAVKSTTICPSDKSLACTIGRRTREHDLPYVLTQR